MHKEYIKKWKNKTANRCSENPVPVKYFQNPLWCLYARHYECILVKWSGILFLLMMRWYDFSTCINPSNNWGKKYWNKSLSLFLTLWKRGAGHTLTEKKNILGRKQVTFWKLKCRHLIKKELIYLLTECWRWV